MQVLVVGGGGREHALARRLSQSGRVDRLFCAPGNGGTAGIAENLDISAEDVDGLRRFAKRQKIDLTLVGPEDALCAGIVDAFEAEGLRIFGPGKLGARIEGDKAYAKELMRQQSVPTAETRIFTRYSDARQYVASREGGLVIKAAGLAKGKGAIVCDEPAEGLLVLEKIMVERCFGDAGKSVLVEERLTGPECSIMALIDGRTIYTLEASQDHKPIGEGDTGPNTGGMGAYSPAPFVTDQIAATVEREVLVPIVDALRRDGAEYRGVLYAGLMLTHAGPKVLEFNCRFGDPEAQPVLMRLRSDLVEVIEAVLDGKLDSVAMEWDSRPAVCVVMASGGYPNAYKKGYEITGLDDVAKMDDVHVFHAGTHVVGDKIVTAGGRVLGVTALGDSIADAQRRAYEAAERIHFESAYYRRDIGNKALDGSGRAGG